MNRIGTIRIAFLGSICAVLIFSLPVFSQSKKDLRKAGDLIKQGNNSFNQKNYRSAIDKYAEALVLVPKHPEAHFWKGYAHWHLKENEPALKEFDAALSNGYKRPLDVYKVRWSLFAQQKNYDAALSDVRAGLQLDPQNLMFLAALGEIAYGKGDHQGALDAFLRLAELQPANADNFYNLAKVYASQGNLVKQAEAAQEAIKLSTRYLGDAYFLLGDAHHRERRYSQAIDAYQKSISAKPDLLTAYRNLADVYRAENRFSDAIDISKKALRAFPNNGDIYTDLSWYYSLADRHEDAVQAALAAITFKPGQYIAYTNLCRAYNDTKQYQSAISACNNALKLQPDDGETYFYMARAYDLLQRPDLATKYYKLAVKGLEDFTQQNPDYSDGFYLLGNAYFADNQRDKAIAAYNKCLQLSPRFVKARYNLGIIHVLTKNKTAAEEQYRRLESLDTALAAKLKTEIDKL